MSTELAVRQSSRTRLFVLAGWLVVGGAVFGAGYAVIFINGLGYVADLIADGSGSQVDLSIPSSPGVWLLVTAGAATVVILAAHLRRRPASAAVGLGERIVSALGTAAVWWGTTFLVSLIPMVVIAILLREDASKAALLMMLAVGPLVAWSSWPFVSEAVWPSPRSDRLTRGAVRLVRYLVFKAGKSPRAGDVWFAEVEFAEGRGSKDRPVLILGPSDHFTWEALMFTSADKRGRPTYFRSQTLIHGQRKSWLKLDRLVDLKPRDLRARAGSADLETLQVAHAARQKL